jgi:hypothetical protein
VPAPSAAPRIRALLHELAEALWEDRHRPASDLALGQAGSALFLGHLSRHPGFEWMNERAEELLGLAVERVREAAGFGLLGGYLGIAWCVEHLCSGILQNQEGDANAGVDEVILERLGQDPWTEPYDLISGLAGIGVYALERLPRASGEAILGRVLDHLERLAVPRGPGLAWLTPPGHLPLWQRRNAPQGYFNLGVAHGIPAVLGVLGAMKAYGLEPARSGRLLEGGMAWLATQFQEGEDGCLLARWCPAERETPPPELGRIAWCYGDLGASMVLLTAARHARNPSWEGLALTLARRAASRPLGSAGVRDACLCHGSAGNLHVFHRLWRATGESVFLEAARAWLDQVLDTRRPGEGFAGYRTYHPPTDADGTLIEGADPWRDTPGLLEGACGTGLALLSCLEDVDPAWDRCLLLSTPPLPSFL